MGKKEGPFSACILENNGVLSTPRWIEPTGFENVETRRPLESGKTSRVQRVEMVPGEE